MIQKKTKKQAMATDVKGEFLMELITGRNNWLSKIEPGNADNEQCKEFAEAYERIIFAFTSPQIAK